MRDRQLEISLAGKFGFSGFLKVGHTCLVGSRRRHLNYEDVSSTTGSQGDIFPSAVRIPRGLGPPTRAGSDSAVLRSEREGRKDRRPSGPRGPHPTYLSDHWKAHDEETDAAAQRKDRLVRAQVLGELVRDGGHYGLDGGKLEWCQERGV